MKSLLRAVLLFTALGGVLLALWPLGQTLYARRSQAALHAAFAAKAKGRTNKVNRAVRKDSAAGRTPAAKPAVAREVVFPSTKIIAKEADLDAIVVRGVEPDDLRQGPGWMPGTALPGQPGNCVIAGHRNIYGSPFAQLDYLMSGSQITLETPDETFHYLVVGAYSAADNDPSVTAPPKDGSAHLTLVTCTTPKTTYRLIVTAVLSE